MKLGHKQLCVCLHVHVCTLMCTCVCLITGGNQLPQHEDIYAARERGPQSEELRSPAKSW